MPWPAASGVGVVEVVARRPDDVQVVVGGGEEPRLRGEPEVRAERGFERRDEDHVERRAVAPVARALRIRAVGRVLVHRDRHRVDGARDEVRGQRGLGLGDGERADGHAGVADLVPVVGVLRPVVGLEAGLQALVDERRAQQACASARPAPW